MLEIAKNVRKFMSDNMYLCQLELTLSGKSLRDVQIQKRIFQGDSLSSLLLRKAAASFEWGHKKLKINHLLFTDSLVHIVDIFKCGVLLLERGKAFKLNELVLPKGQMIREID